MKISGCVALVTGGASGIGRGICELLLQHDAKVNVIVFTVSHTRTHTHAVESPGPHQQKHMMDTSVTTRTVHVVPDKPNFV